LRAAEGLITEYGQITALLINWSKSLAYWFSHRKPPDWLHTSRGPWAVDGTLSKLLGTPFGLSLQTQDVNQFLYDKREIKRRSIDLTPFTLTSKGNWVQAMN
jgi:hypothetical protein